MSNQVTLTLPTDYDEKDFLAALEHVIEATRNDPNAGVAGVSSLMILDDVLQASGYAFNVEHGLHRPA